TSICLSVKTKYQQMRGYDAFNRSLGAYRQKKARIYTRAEEKYNGKRLASQIVKEFFHAVKEAF
ncbi:TPA: hypothetical protein ACJXJQ_002926, partial [Salmonella enterica subsp. enterica serovar Typhimurium]